MPKILTQNPKRETGCTPKSKTSARVAFLTICAGLMIIGILSLIGIPNTEEKHCVMGMRDVVFGLSTNSSSVFTRNITYKVTATMFNEPVDVRQDSNGFYVCLTDEQYDAYKLYVYGAMKDPIKINATINMDDVSREAGLEPCEDCEYRWDLVE